MSGATWAEVAHQLRMRLTVEEIPSKVIGGTMAAASAAVAWLEKNAEHAAPSEEILLAAEPAIKAEIKAPRSGAVLKSLRLILAQRDAPEIDAAKYEALVQALKQARNHRRNEIQKAKYAAKHGRTQQDAPPEETMSTGTTDDQQEYEEGEEGQEEQQDDPSADELGTAPPSQRRPPRRTQQVQAQPVFVMPMQARIPKQRMPHAQAQPQRPRVVKLDSRVRIYKRGAAGKRILINDYTASEIGGSLQRFLKEFVDVDYAEPTGVTTYEVVEVDDRDNERQGASATYTIESAPQNSPQQPMDQLRDAFSLISDLREQDELKASRNAELLTAAKKKSLEGGDFSQLMMLMMMDRFGMGSGGGRMDGSEQILLKLMEKLGIGSGGHVASMPAPATPMFIPPPQPQMPSAMDKLLEVMMAKMVAPQPTLADQFKDFMMFKQMMGGDKPAVDPGMQAILAQLSMLSANMNKHPEVSTLDAAVGTFEKFHTVIKTLAPQINAGGLTGALQGILTPKLAEVLGDTLAGGLAKASGSGHGQPNGQQVLPAGTPTPVKQPPPIPPDVMEKVNGLRVAQTKDFQVEAMTALVQVMWASPTYKAQIEPVLAALLQGNVMPAQQAIVALASEARPELATVDFANAVIRALAVKAGMPVPAALEQAAPPGGNGQPKEGKVIPMVQPVGQPVVQPPVPLNVQVGGAAAEAVDAPVAAPVPVPAAPAPAN